MNAIKWVLEKLKALIKSIVAPMFKAGKGIAHYIKLVVTKVKDAVNSFFEWSSNIFNKVAYAIYMVVKSALIGLWKGSTFAFDLFVGKVIKGIIGLYFWFFEFILKAMKNLGILGELIFTIFGLIWLIWPMYVVYKMDAEIQYWIGASILTLILIVRGR